MPDKFVALVGLIAIMGTSYVGHLHSSHPEADETAYYTKWFAIGASAPEE
jgi:hypothetical protein